MPKRTNTGDREALAIAIAAGRSVTEWAAENHVPKRTAYRWSGSPEVRDRVKTIRRRSVDKAIGRLTEAASSAADQIVQLATQAAAEAVRLQAARAILADLITVSDHQQLDDRIAELERRFEADSAKETENP